MDPASAFIILVVFVLALGGGVFLFFTAAGLELREGRRRRRDERRPEHVRVEHDERHVVYASPSTPTAPAAKEVAAQREPR
jgi:hypothetical protein